MTTRTTPLQHSLESDWKAPSVIEFNCPSCEKTLRTKPEKAGAKAKCPGCGEVLTVPGATTPPASVTPPTPAASTRTARKPTKPPEDEFGNPKDEFSGFGDDEEEITTPTQDEFWGAGDEFGGQTRMPRRQKQSSRASSPRASRQQECPMCGEMTSSQSRKCEHCGESLTKSDSGSRSRRRGYEMDHAGFWLRFVANLIDSILVNIVVWVLFFLVLLVIGGIGTAMGADQPGRPGDPGAAQIILGLLVWLFFGLIFIVLPWLYYAYMESGDAKGTFGKQIMGIEVTDTNGRQISFLNATGRHFGKILSGMMCGAGFIMAGFTEQKQALHDIVANTLVVRK